MKRSGDALGVIPGWRRCLLTSQGMSHARESSKVGELHCVAAVYQEQLLLAGEVEGEGAEGVDR